MIVPIKENITLENVKNSNYWDLIAILVWNHYSESRFQDESKIEITESWCGKSKGSVCFSSEWDKPDYTEEGYTRTLWGIRIVFTRTDYITHINLTTSGRISIWGYYVDKSKKSSPIFDGFQNALGIINWQLHNKFVEFKPTI